MFRKRLLAGSRPLLQLLTRASSPKVCAERRVTLRNAPRCVPAGPVKWRELDTRHITATSSTAVDQSCARGSAALFNHTHRVFLSLCYRVLIKLKFWAAPFTRFHWTMLWVYLSRVDGELRARHQHPCARASHGLTRIGPARPSYCYSGRRHRLGQGRQPPLLPPVLRDSTGSARITVQAQ